MSLERHVALVGARGSGKTSTGRELARLLGVPFVDVDDEIARSSRDDARIVGGAHSSGRALTAGDVLSALGEANFRDREAEALAAALARSQTCVVATGGGVVLHEGNRALLAARARVAWLRAPPDILAARLRADPTPRPPLLGADAADEAAEILARRTDLYRAVADVEIETDASTPAEVARAVADWLARGKPAREA